MKTHYQHNHVLQEVSKCSVDNRVTLETVVYLSVSGLGARVGFVGEDTGLVSSTGAPFRRPALTSANLHGCTAAWFLCFQVLMGNMGQNLI